LGLGPIALAFCAASNKNHHAAIAELLAKHGRDQFAAAWLRDYRRLDWAAELLNAPLAALQNNSRAP
jgi:type IV secretion system protein TrbE